VEVVTFYSYKGGVGRTLLLAWMARALAARGKRVLALDLDLEAPGLPTKLRPESAPRVGFGVVDLLVRFQGGASPPTDLAQWCLPVATERGSLWLLPAGAAPSTAYWQALSRISWDSLFAERAADGARFFLWLRDALAKAVEPDFLLIDARAGVTEMGAAAVGLLADTVIAVTNTSPESKMGLREVLRAAMGSPRAENRRPLQVLPILSRVPVLLGADSITRLVDHFRHFLNEEADPLVNTVAAKHVLVVRHEETLLEDEQRALDGPRLGVSADYERVLEWLLGEDAPDLRQAPPLHRSSQVAAAIRAEQEIVASIRERVEQNPSLNLPMLADALMSLGGRLANVGQREQARSVTEQAVAIYRRLAKEQPELFSPELAGGLNNLGNRSIELGRREEALMSLAESLAIFRELASQEPDIFLADLARCLSNFSGVQGELGKRGEALASAAESVAIRRHLARQRPDVFLPDLATSLSNLGVSQRASGRWEEALASITEAAEVLRRLVEQGKNNFLPDLAFALNNLGLIQHDLGRPTEALASAEQAVAILRTLAERQPEIFRPDLAGSLHNLGNNLSAVGRAEEALASISQAVAIYRDLAMQWPDAFLPDLARGLSDLGLRQAELGEREEALVSAMQALAVRRKLVEASHDAFAPEVVISLNNVAKAHGELAQQDAAVASSAEAVELSMKLVGREPRAFANLFQVALDGYRHHLRAVGRPVDTDPLVRRAIASLQRVHVRSGD
jgi:tetratricopeptide (TPR) repeat protein